MGMLSSIYKEIQTYKQANNLTKYQLFTRHTTYIASHVRIGAKIKEPLRRLSTSHRCLEIQNISGHVIASPHGRAYYTTHINSQASIFVHHL
jgi:hypothetical protein